MKKQFILISAILLMLSIKGISQNVYVNSTGVNYHTKACKLYTKNFEEVPLWKAQGPYGKRPCGKCKPPIKESNTATNKKPAPKTQPAAPAKK